MSPSRSSPPSTVNSRTTPSPNSAAASAATSTSRSTASSHVSLPEVRRWTWRNRSRTRTDGCPPCSSTHSARVKLVSDGSAAAYPGAITTPNCQRLRFFWAEAR